MKWFANLLLFSVLTLIAVGTSMPVPCQAQFGREVGSFNFGVSDLLRDPARGRVYATVPAQNSVAVIDSDAVRLIAMVYCGSTPMGMGLAHDGTRLYVANSGSSAEGIAVMDLESLVVVTNYTTIGRARDVAVGLDHRLYALGSGIEGYDGHTGQYLGSSLGWFYGGGLVMHPNRMLLYYYDTGLSPSSMTRYDVSAWPPVVQESVNRGGNGQSLAISADGLYLAHCAGGYYAIDKLNSTDLGQVFGTMATGPYPRAATFNPDGTRLFAAHSALSPYHIDVWNAQTYSFISEIATPGLQDAATELECDRAGRVLFAGFGSALKAYFIGPSTTATNLEVVINHAAEIRWQSSPGVLYQVQWKAGPGQGAAWQNLGGQVLGTGLTLSVFDNTRDSRAKYYQVVIVQP